MYSSNEILYYQRRSLKVIAIVTDYCNLSISHWHGKVVNDFKIVTVIVDYHFDVLRLHRQWKVALTLKSAVDFDRCVQSWKVVLTFACLCWLWQIIFWDYDPHCERAKFLIWKHQFLIWKCCYDLSKSRRPFYPLWCLA